LNSRPLLPLLLASLSTWVSASAEAHMPLQGDAWQTAQAMPPGQKRALAFAVLMQDPAASLPRDRVRMLWEAAVAEARELRIDTALSILEPLHLIEQATWSALDTSLLLRQLGRYQDADAVLTSMLEDGPGSLTQPPPSGSGSMEDAALLWCQRGILAFGASRHHEGRSHLGRALALGSADAGMVLGFRDLHAGRPDRARAAFRADLGSLRPGPWSSRGWGLSLVSDPANLFPGQESDSIASHLRDTYVQIQ